MILQTNCYNTLVKVIIICICKDINCKIEIGYCHCGCGNKTRLASKTSIKRNQIKDIPNRFLTGHAASPLKVMGDSKTCPSCKNEKLKSEYHKNTSQCKECKGKHNKTKYWDNVETNRLKSRNYYKENSEKYKERGRKRKEIPRYHQKAHLKYTYNISLETYDKKVEIQGGKCDICKILLSECNRTAVDHNHDTEQIRGILCMGCNTALGKFKDSTEYLKRAIEYLEKWN